MNYLTMEQVQEKLHFTQKKTKAFFGLSGLPVIQIGREKLIAEDALDAWLADQAAAGNKIRLDYSKL